MRMVIKLPMILSLNNSGANSWTQSHLEILDDGPCTPGAVKGVKSEDRPKGPKLGGSRSARAAMRALEEKAAKRSNEF